MKKQYISVSEALAVFIHSYRITAGNWQHPYGKIFVQKQKIKLVKSKIKTFRKRKNLKNNCFFFRGVDL